MPCGQPELLGEVLEMLRASAAVAGGGVAGSATALQVAQVSRVISQWAQVHGVEV